MLVVGAPREFVDRFFMDCAVAGHVANAYGIRNEETVEHPDIFICQSVRAPWPQLWTRMQIFG